MWIMNEQLSKHTTFRIGGCAQLYCRPQNLDELRLAVREARQSGLPVRILGGGSNLLVDDRHLRIAVIHIASPGFAGLEIDGTQARVGAGLRLGAFLKRCARKGLSGLEALSGIPGTVGGALVGNAGAHGTSIGDRVSSVTVLDEALNVRELSPAEAAFTYRSSRLHGCVVLGARFDLVRREARDILVDLTRNRERKLNSQPVRSCSAGCIFRNPNGDSAGRLIDLCGLKGKRVGGAEISPLHANFIVNDRTATAEEVMELVDHVRSSVRKLFKVDLELEIEHWAA